MNTPARISVTPSRFSAKRAVGVEPTLTTGQGRPAARRWAAAATPAARSASAAAAIAPGSLSP